MPVFDLTRMGTDAGVVVLAVADNGDNNLDGPDFSTWRSWGDSGAILVGAGSADTGHNRMLYPGNQPGSNFGSRVSVQGWGENVATTGWIGDLATVDGDIHRKYTFSFSGTSSATPMVAAAAVLLQQYGLTQGMTPLDSRDMRSLLAHTGIPQGSLVPGHIGPFIDLHDAIGQFDLADLAVQSTQAANGIITTQVSNNGPRIAPNVSATITYSSGSPFTLTAVDVPASCQFDPPPQCAGVCPSVLQCSLAEITVEQPIVIAFAPGCEQFQSSINVTAGVQMSG